MDDERLESRRLANALRAQIGQEATYPPGAKLPSYRQLVAEYAVARNTVGVALRLLESEGLVEIRRGSGAYVRNPDDVHPAQPDDLRAELRELNERLDRTKRELAAAQTSVANLLKTLPLSADGE